TRKDRGTGSEFKTLLVACSRECFSEGFRSARRLRRPMPVAVRAISRKTMCEVQPGLASPAQRRIERQPGGREPEMMQKHDLEARVLECAAGLPGGIENQAHGLSVVAALPALLRREEGGEVQGRTLVVGTHEVREGLLALLRRQIGDLFLTGEDIITVEVTRVVDLEVVRLLAVDHGNFRDGLVRVGLHLVEAVTDPQRENI